MTAPDSGIISRRTLLILLSACAVELVVIILLPPPNPPWSDKLAVVSTVILCMAIVLHRIPRDTNLWVPVLRRLRQRWRRISAVLIAVIGTPVLIAQWEHRGMSNLPWWTTVIAIVVLLAVVSLISEGPPGADRRRTLE